MRPVEFMEVFPFGQFFIQIFLFHMAQQLVELLLVGAVRTLYVAFKLRQASFDVDVSDPFVLYSLLKFSNWLLPDHRTATIMDRGGPHAG